MMTHILLDSTLGQNIRVRIIGGKIQKFISVNLQTAIKFLVIVFNLAGYKCNELSFFGSLLLFSELMLGTVHNQGGFGLTGGMVCTT